jgi:hypothetical protein
MKKINNFDFFIEESYLESNYAPLYHFTDYWSLESILEDNEIKVGWVDNPFLDNSKKIISFTRNKDLDMSHYKNDLDIVICLDKNKLILDGYKLYPYDFFIQSGKESMSKSNLERKYPFEFEEASILDIKNIDKYLISVDFKRGTLFDSVKSVKILKKKNIPIYEDGRRLL